MKHCLQIFVWLITSAMMLTTSLPGIENLIENEDLADFAESGASAWKSVIRDASHGTDADAIPDDEKTEATFEIVDNPEGKRGPLLSVHFQRGTGRALWNQMLKDALLHLQTSQRYKISYSVRYELEEPPDNNKRGITARLNIWDTDWKNLLEVYVLPRGIVMNDDFSALPDESTQQDWIEVSYEFEAPENASHAAFYIGIEGTPGKVWVDNVSLVAVEESN